MRLPLQRFLGVPADPAEATRWDARLEQNAIKLCVEATGFEYQVEAFNSPAEQGMDPNMVYLASLSTAKQAEYRQLLAIGTNYDDSCLRSASDRVHPLNTMGDEFEPYTERFANDPQIVAAKATITQCILQHGEDPTKRSDSQAACESNANWRTVSSTVESDVETSFILDHIAELRTFLANRAPLEG